VNDAALTSHKWEFKARFRRHAYGWRSQPAIQRVREAVSEIKKVSRQDPVLAADGAVALIERLSPALEQVDSSSGAIGTAVNKAIDALVAIIAAAPADPATRDRWLERLWAAHEADEIPYIELIGDYWGDLCASTEVASRWADELIGTTNSPSARTLGFGGSSTEPRLVSALSSAPSGTQRSWISCKVGRSGSTNNGPTEPARL
jgi:hypothetical protein